VQVCQERVVVVRDLRRRLREAVEVQGERRLRRARLDAAHDVAQVVITKEVVLEHVNPTIVPRKPTRERREKSA
jgi:hypothetical protein